MRSYVLRLAALMVAGALGHPAQGADVSVNVNVGVPNVVFQTPPQMVWVPQSGVYVAYGSPQALFFVDGDYYVYDHGRWYVSVAYQGPWGEVRIDTLPRPLRGYRDQDWDRYQHEADHRHRRGDDDGDEHPSFYARRNDRHSGHAYGHDKQKDREQHRHKHEDDD